MKNSPQEYVLILIDKYSDIINPNFLYVTTPVVRCAIIDVENTLNSLKQVIPCESEFYKYHFETLTILKSKL